MYHIIEIYGGVKEQLQAFSTFSLDGHKRYIQVLAALSREKRRFLLSLTRAGQCYRKESRHPPLRRLTAG
jgi:hypothetical protein